MVKLVNKTQVSLTKEGAKGEIFPRSSYSHNFPCAPQQLSLVCKSWTSISLSIWALREGMLCPLALFPAELIPRTVFNWVILFLIRFIAREGDSVELRDRESYICGKERRLLLPSQCFSEQREGNTITGRGAPNALRVNKRCHPSYSKPCNQLAQKCFHFHRWAGVLDFFFFL